MQELRQKIQNEIGKIIDTDLNITLLESDSIEEVVINGSVVQVYLKFVQPVQWIYSEIKQKCIDTIEKIAPDLTYEIFIDEKMATPKSQQVLPNIKNVIAVSSGKGGVGKSQVASNIAATLSLQGAKVGILDADIYGPSQPTMYGVQGEQFKAMQTADGRTVAVPVEKYGIKLASMGFIMNRDEAAVLRGPMLASYLTMLIEQVEWGNLDFLIFDLPPGTGDIQLTLTQKVPLSGAVIVTTPQEISLADVRRSIAMFNKVNVDILGIIENMSYFVPPDMPDKKYFIFGKEGGKQIAEDAGLRILGQIPLDINTRESGDNGTPIVLTDLSPNQKAIYKQTVGEMVSELRFRNYYQETSGIDISL